MKNRLSSWCTECTDKMAFNKNKKNYHVQTVKMKYPPHSTKLIKTTLMFLERFPQSS